MYHKDRAKVVKKKWITQTNHLKFHFFLRNILVDTCFFLDRSTPYTNTLAKRSLDQLPVALFVKLVENYLHSLKIQRTSPNWSPRKFLICGESGGSRRLMTWASFFATGLPNASAMLLNKVVYVVVNSLIFTDCYC